MKRRFFFIFLLFSGFCKADPVDSLLLELNKDIRDTQRVNILNTLTYYKYQIDIKTAVPYCMQAVALAKKIHFYNGLITSYLYFSYLEKSSGKQETAIKYLDSALAICDKQKLEYKKAKLLNQLGNIYGDQGDISKSLAFCLKAVEIGEKYNDKKSLLGYYANIGICFLSNKQYSKCKEYLKKALSLANEAKDIKSRGTVYNNFGTLFINTKELDSALHYFQLGEADYTTIHNQRGLGHSAYYLGYIYNEKKNYPQALTAYQKAALIYKESGNYAELANINISIGEIYLKQNQLDLALDYANRSLSEAKKNESAIDFKEAYSVLKQIYEAKGDYKKALGYYTKFVELKDSLFNTESSQQMADMQTKYESDKKQQENEMLQEKNSVATKTIQQQVYIEIAIGLICLLLVIGAVIIYRSNKQKHKANVELTKKNTLIEKQKEIVEEKQKEILDSIHYARRIQRALLASENYIERNLNRLRSEYK